MDCLQIISSINTKLVETLLRIGIEEKKVNDLSNKLNSLEVKVAETENLKWIKSLLYVHGQYVVDLGWNLILTRGTELFEKIKSTFDVKRENRAPEYLIDIPHSYSIY